MLPALNRWLASDKAMGRPPCEHQGEQAERNKQVGEVQRPQEGGPTWFRVASAIGARSAAPAATI
jgi:hypothetical protein